MQTPSPALRLVALSDDALLARVADLLTRSRGVEAELIWHLAEVDTRRLYLREACPSMHIYATTRLHLSDAEAYLRITVARLSRRFPVVLAMVADGRLHLSAIAKLAPHLRDEDGEALLARAIHKSKREIEILVAELAPRPDAPSVIRRLPPARPAAVPPVTVPLVPGGVSNRELASRPSPVVAHSAQPAGPPPIVAPIGPSRYKVQFTANGELHDKITRAQSLLRHQIADGDLAAVVDRAMTVLLRDLERARFAATPAPRKKASEVDPTPSSRRIAGPIRRAVWTRDGGQCTFRDRQGRRCPARDRLEFHHVVPFGQGGDHSEGNLVLTCAMHNRYQAELDYGAAFMAAHRRGTHARDMVPLCALDVLIGHRSRVAAPSLQCSPLRDGPDFRPRGPGPIDARCMVAAR